MKHPNFEPHMPEVDVWPDMEKTFQLARETAAKDNNPAIVVVTPGHRMLVPVSVKLLTQDERQSRECADLGRLVSLTSFQNISAICMTELSVGLKDVCDFNDQPFTGSRAIPFFGYLMAMGALGHNVIIFEGHPSTLTMGCHNADVLIVDGGMLPFLQADWASVAHSVMRGERKIYIFQRDGTIQQLSI
jgi:hypothetical protein